MKQQRIFNTSLGNDSHTRNFSENYFKRQTYEVFDMIVGEIEFSEPEPIFDQNMVTVKMSRGGKMTSVAYPGAFIDPITGNQHGLYEGPVPGQMVIVGFESGNRFAPFVVNRYPYQGVGNTVVEQKYIHPLTNAAFNPSDIILGHQSGSFLVFNTGLPLTDNGIAGSIKLKAMTEFKMEALTLSELKSPTITLTASTVLELNGNADFAVRYNSLKTAFDQLKTDHDNFVTLFNAHIHITTATVAATPVPGVIAPTVSPGLPSTADMAGAKVTTVKIA